MALPDKRAQLVCFRGRPPSSFLACRERSWFQTTPWAWAAARMHWSAPFLGARYRMAPTSIPSWCAWGCRGYSIEGVLLGILQVSIRYVL